ncbi:MAG TPA: hypothetical protein VFY92_13035 [Hyphomicrobiaceae bacterium]|nr:hypothetical protein [Hyphomicrobiaceae bacterium]
MLTEASERIVRRGLIAAALAGLVFDLAASFGGRTAAAQWLWAGGTLPVVIALLVSMGHRRRPSDLRQTPKQAKGVERPAAWQRSLLSG